MKGYAVIVREWKPGDRIELELPMAPQKISADRRVEATRGQVALAYGPIVYSVETADGQDIDRRLGRGPITPRWRPDLLGGVMTLAGRWDNGTPMLAVPYYAHMNRTGRPLKFSPHGAVVNYAPGTAGGFTVSGAAPTPSPTDGGIVSKVWLQA